jgi:hypothetical protein
MHYSEIPMTWLLGGAVLVLFLFSTFFRKFTSGLVILAAVGGAIYLLHQQEKTLSLSRIPASQIVLADIRLNPEFRMYQMSGRITNQSPTYTLRQVTVVVTMKECAGESSSRECRAIDAVEKTIYLDLPPGQGVDFNESVYFSDDQVPSHSHPEWECAITQSVAD